MSYFQERLSERRLRRFILQEPLPLVFSGIMSELIDSFCFSGMRLREPVFVLSYLFSARDPRDSHCVPRSRHRFHERHGNTMSSRIPRTARSYPVKANPLREPSGHIRIRRQKFLHRSFFETAGLSVPDESASVSYCILRSDRQDTVSDSGPADG